VSEVIKKYESIIKSAKDFDSFLANKLSKMSTIEIEISQRLSIMIKEAEFVLGQRLEEFNAITDKERIRAEKLLAEAVQAQKKLEQDKSQFQQEKNVHLEVVEKYNSENEKLNKRLAEYQALRIKLDEDIEQKKLTENRLKSQEESLLQREQNLVKEKDSLKSSYTDITKEHKKLMELQQKIDGYHIEKREQAIDERLKGLETQQKALDDKKTELDNRETELNIKAKNLKDKETNLDAYKQEIEFQMAKFKQELEQEKRNNLLKRGKE